MNVSQNSTAKSIGSYFALTKNQLKLLALITMLLDHIGYILFPQIILLRIVGRLSYPIFAFSIYEGCRYTRHKAVYFLRILGLGLLCAGGYYFYSGIVYGNILITFSLSICILYSIDLLKNAISAERRISRRFIVAILLTAGGVIGAALTCQFWTVDYGFYGIMVPVFAELFHVKDFPNTAYAQKALPLIGLSTGLLLLSMQMGGIQYYSLLSLLLLALSGGKRGTYDIKWLFYIFYPVHLLAIGAVSMIM